MVSAGAGARVRSPNAVEGYAEGGTSGKKARAQPWGRASRVGQSSGGREGRKRKRVKEE
jgi:hypothetical protein